MSSPSQPDETTSLLPEQPQPQPQVRTSQYRLQDIEVGTAARFIALLLLDTPITILYILVRNEHLGHTDCNRSPSLVSYLSVNNKPILQCKRVLETQLNGMLDRIFDPTEYRICPPVDQQGSSRPRLPSRAFISLPRRSVPLRGQREPRHQQLELFGTPTTSGLGGLRYDLWSARYVRCASLILCSCAFAK